MDEVLRKRLFIVSAFFNILFLLIAAGQCNSARLQKIARDKETLERLESQEQANKFSQEKIDLAEELKKAEAELAQEKASSAEIKKDLAQEQLINQSLKNELEKLSKLKSALEEDLKKAVISGKAEKPKK